MVGEKPIANLEDEVKKAKAFLQKKDNKKGSSVYDHLCDVLNRVLCERPHDATDLVETYIRDRTKDDPISNRQDLLQQAEFAEQQVKLFQKSDDGDDDGANENGEELELPLPNCMDLSYHFEQAGVGLDREEMWRIFLALKQLLLGYPLSALRFWGKVFGIKANYIVAEVEFREGEGEEEGKPEGEDEGQSDEMQDDRSQGTDGPAEDNGLPKPAWKPPPIIPKEENRSGANKKTYFVCNKPGEGWTKLPAVTPAQISVARHIRKFFTGNLSAPIVSFPPFPGNEANYLRAQIARISASTQISPAGYYMFDEDEEEEDGEEELHESYLPNAEFEGLSLKELNDSSMSGWVHHTRHILPQGRCKWYNPNNKPEEDFEDEDAEDKVEEEDTETKPEVGPQLLSSVAEDEAVGANMPAWSTFVSSRLLPEYAVAVARSNRWPGAYAFAKSRKYENIYIGWGLKYVTDCYNPPLPPSPLSEFADSQAIMEMDDPTVAEEQALKERQEEAAKAAEEMDNIEDDEDE